MDQPQPPTFTPHVPTSVPPTEPPPDAHVLFARAHADERGVDTRHWSRGDALGYLAQHLRPAPEAFHGSDLCASCGADPKVAPKTGEELPIVKGALDAQADAERRFFAERQRADDREVQCAALRAELAGARWALAAAHQELLRYGAAERRITAELRERLEHPDASKKMVVFHGDLQSPSPFEPALDAPSQPEWMPGDLALDINDETRVVMHAGHGRVKIRSLDTDSAWNVLPSTLRRPARGRRRCGRMSIDKTTPPPGWQDLGNGEASRETFWRIRMEAAHAIYADESAPAVLAFAERVAAFLKSPESDYIYAEQCPMGLKSRTEWDAECVTEAARTNGRLPGEADDV